MVIPTPLFGLKGGHPAFCFSYHWTLIARPGQIRTSLRHRFSTSAVQTETLFSCPIPPKKKIGNNRPGAHSYAPFDQDAWGMTNWPLSHPTDPSGWGWDSQTEPPECQKEAWSGCATLRVAECGPRQQFRIAIPPFILGFVFRFFCQKVVRRKVSEHKTTSIIFGHGLTAISNQFFLLLFSFFVFWFFSKQWV